MPVYPAAWRQGSTGSHVAAVIAYMVCGHCFTCICSEKGVSHYLCCLQKVGLKSHDRSQPKVHGADGSVTARQPALVLPGATAHSSAVATHIIPRPDTALDSSARLQSPTGEIMWCPDPECPRHKCFDKYNGYTKWSSLYDHIKVHHKQNADSLLITARRSVATRYWCPHLGCPRSHGSDSGFEGWLEHRYLTKHMLTHANATAGSLSASATAAAAKAPWSLSTARRPSSVPTSRRTEHAKASMLPDRGQFWCPHVDCPKRHGGDNDFVGYCSVQSLRSHLYKAHKRSQRGAEDGSDIAFQTLAAAAEDEPINARVCGEDSRFWCPFPDCTKCRGSGSGFKGYSTQDSLRSHLGKAHKTLRQQALAGAPNASTAAASGADHSRLWVQLGKRDFRLDVAAADVQMHTAEPAPKRRRVRSKKHEASPVASSQPENAFSDDGRSQQLELAATRLADADPSQLKCATATAADGEQRDALPSLDEQFFCSDPTCPQWHGSDNAFCGCTAFSGLNGHPKDKHLDGPQSSSQAEADCNTGHTESSAEAPLPDRAWEAAIGEMSAAQQLVPEAEADDAGPCDALLPSKGCFWCPDLDCPKQHSYDGFAGFRHLDKLQRHVKRQQHGQNGHQSSACTAVVTMTGSHSSLISSKMLQPAQTSRSVADAVLYPAQHPRSPPTALLTAQPEGLSAAAAASAPAASGSATATNDIPQAALPAQAGPALDQRSLWLSAQATEHDASMVQGAAVNSSLVSASIAGANSLAGHIVEHADADGEPGVHHTA